MHYCLAAFPVGVLQLHLVAKSELMPRQHHGHRMAEKEASPASHKPLAHRGHRGWVVHEGHMLCMADLKRLHFFNS